MSKPDEDVTDEAWETARAILGHPGVLVSASCYQRIAEQFGRAIMAAEQRAEWQPIATAPDSPDAKLRVLVFDPSQRNPVEARIADGTWWRDRAKRYGPNAAPTHWLALPGPPVPAPMQTEEAYAMSKPDDIRQDVWDKAAMAFLAAINEQSDDWTQSVQVIARAIMAATAAEHQANIEACKTQAEQAKANGCPHEALGALWCASAIGLQAAIRARSA